MDLYDLVAAVVPPQYLAYVAVVVALCSALDAAMPQPSAGAPKALVAARRAVSFVALNLGHAKNAVRA